MSLIITSALSGLVGALAGGGIALVSQILNRKWKKEDCNLEYKKQLYSEIIGIGRHYRKEGALTSINNNVAKALLICSDELRQVLIQYAASVERANVNWDSKDFNKDFENNENIRFHKEMVIFMRKELGTN
jgi:hypothetical protein